MDELTDKEKRQMSQITFMRKQGSGLYFDYFDDKVKAFRKIQEFARRYRYSGLHSNTIKSLIAEYAEEGINFHPDSMSKWLQQVFNITVQKTGYGRPKQRKKIHTSIDKEVYEIRKEMNKIHGRPATDWFNLWFRVSMNLPIEEVFAFFKDGYGETLVGFLDHKGEIKGLYVGQVEQGTKKLIESLANDAEEHGFGYIKRRCQSLGFYTIGADDEEE